MNVRAMPEIAKSACKELKRLPETMRLRAIEMIGRLDTEPSLGKKLRGRLSEYRSASLGRSYRIIYSTATGTVKVVAVTHRRDAYR